METLPLPLLFIPDLSNHHLNHPSIVIRDPSSMALQQPLSLFLLLGTVLLLIPALLAGNCGPKFQGKCSCGKANYDNRLQYVVNCTDQGFKDTSVLEHLPKETEVLIFTGNNIVELPWNVFGTITELTALKIGKPSNQQIPHQLG